MTALFITKIRVLYNIICDRSSLLKKKLESGYIL